MIRAHLLLFPFALALSPPVAAESKTASSDCDTPELRAAAEGGDRNSQNDLGRCLMGAEDEAKRAEARRWYKLGMEAGDVEAKNGYAVTLLQGIGGPEDAESGQKLMEEAATEGSYGAKLTLADHYLQGGGFYDKDEAKALALLVEVADSGAVKGASQGWIEWRIGMMHLNGTGTAINRGKAWHWVVRGSENGAEQAMISRAVMLATGEGTTEDDVAAREWYSKVAFGGQSNWSRGMRGLGWMLWNGEGGQVDRRKACTYLNLAYRAGDDKAENILDQISPQLSDEEKETCSSDAQTWIDENLPKNQQG